MISVVVPVYNETENLAPLLAEISKAAQDAPITEIVYVNDASTDNTVETLLALRETYPMLRVISHDLQAGQSAAMWTGVRAATSKIVVFLDGDGQNNPADIKLLYAAYEKAANDGKPVMVAGQRAKRQDNWLKRVSSRLANKIRAAALKDGTRDTGCSLKLVPREQFLQLPFFNHMHRFLPALFKRDGVVVLHVDVSHRPRQKGVSKYGFWDRLRAGLSDLLGVMWLNMRGRPQGFSEHEVQ